MRSDTTTSRSGRSTQTLTSRWERRQVRLVTRQATASTPTERAGAAWDYLRAALADPAVPAADRAEVAEAAAEALVQLGDRLHAAARAGTTGGGHRG